VYNHVVGSPAQRFFLLLFSFLCPNFVIWKKKIWKFSKSFNKSSQIYTRKTKKFHFPFFLSRNNKICQKKKTPPLESACEIGWGCRRMCILVTFGHVGHQLLCKSEEPGKISDVQKNANFTSVGPVYIPGQIWSWYWVQDWFLASMRQV